MAAGNAFSCKYPWYSDEGKLLGVYGISILQNAKANLISHSETYDKLLDLMYSCSYQKDNIPLTKRQRDCLIYLAKGMTIKKISTTLGLSARTVEHYLETVKIKLKCKNRYELIKTASELRLL